jgi:hypothetical protein
MVFRVWHTYIHTKIYILGHRLCGKKWPSVFPISTFTQYIYYINIVIFFFT